MSQTPTPTRSRADSPDNDDPADALDSNELDTDLADLSLADDPDPEATPPPTPSKAEQEDIELERFRNEWKKEVTSRKDAPGDQAKKGKGKEQNIPRDSGSVQPVDSSPSKAATSPKSQLKAISRHVGDDEDEDEAGPSTSAHMARKAPAAATEKTAGSKQDQAVALYARAVEHEQSGQLNEALMMYRKAFKLDDDVDRLYARAATTATQAAASAVPDTPSSTDVVSSAAPAEEPYSFQRHLQLQPDYEKTQPLPPQSSRPTASTSSRQSPLTSLLSRLPIPADQITFVPAEEHLPLPLAKLPIELLDPIIAYLDIATIERFALTCWRARYITSRAPKWKRIAEGIYKPPGILPQGKTVKDLDVMGKYAGEWRTALMEEERVRMDGCYISVCHYIRPGAGDQWVTVTHMITYHRFLRFYPDGTVISFLTTDHPSDVVPVLRPSIRGKGLHFGYWRLIRCDSPENSTDAPEPTPTIVDIDGPRTLTAKAGKDKKRARIVITDLMEPGGNTPKYEFEMELALRETGRGRWNKLDMLNYQSINLATGESLGLSLKHQKPFYFSKVKSYHPQL